MDNNEGSSEYKKKFLSDEYYLQHKNKDGKVTGKTEFKKDELTGERWEQHFDKDGNPVSYTEKKKDFWGNWKRITKSGEKTSTSGVVGILIGIVILLYLVYLLIKFLIVPILFASIPLFFIIKGYINKNNKVLYTILGGIFAGIQWLDFEMGWYSSYLIEQASFLIPFLWVLMMLSMISISVSVSTMIFSLIGKKNETINKSNLILFNLISIVIISAFSIFIRWDKIMSLKNIQLSSIVNKETDIISQDNPTYNYVDTISLEIAQNRFSLYYSTLISENLNDLDTLLSDSIYRYMSLNNISKIDVLKDREYYQKRWKVDQLYPVSFYRNHDNIFNYKSKARIFSKENNNIRRDYLISGQVGFNKNGSIDYIFESDIICLNANNNIFNASIANITGSEWVMEQDDHSIPVLFSFKENGFMFIDLDSVLPNSWYTDSEWLKFKTSDSIFYSCIINNGKLFCQSKTPDGRFRYYSGSYINRNQRTTPEYSSDLTPVVPTILFIVKNSNTDNNQKLAVPFVQYLNGEYLSIPACAEGYIDKSEITNCFIAKNQFMQYVNVGHPLYLLNDRKSFSSVESIGVYNYGFSDWQSYSALVEGCDVQTILTNHKEVGAIDFSSVDSEPILPDRRDNEGEILKDKLLVKVDIDGDHFPEYIYECEEYEGISYRIYSFKNNEWKKVFEGGYQGV